MSDIWHIFNNTRIGTPITEEEREELILEEAKYTELLTNEEWIAQDVKANIDLMGYWDRDLTLICLYHDLEMVTATLTKGVVAEY